MLTFLALLSLAMMVVGLIIIARKNTQQRRTLNRLPAHVPETATPLEWEAVAISRESTVLVYVKRGSTSILIGEADIQSADLDKETELLTVKAENRAMVLNSMGIKWDGDVGTTVSVEFAQRIADERNVYEKQVIELKQTIEKIIEPDHFAELVQVYLRKVSPETPLGTIRVVNNGHLLAEIPPGARRGSDWPGYR